MSKIYNFQITDNHGITHYLEGDQYSLFINADRVKEVFVFLDDNMRGAFFNVTSLLVSEGIVAKTDKGLNPSNKEGGLNLGDDD